MPTTIPTAGPHRHDEHDTPRTSSMMERAMARLGSWRTLIVSGVLFAAFALVFFGSAASISVPHVEEACGAPPPDVRFAATAEEVNDFLAGCGEQGRAAYRNLQIADLFYPAVFGLFMTSALALVLKRLFPRNPSIVVLAAVALVGSVLDYLENTLVWLALTAYPEPSPSSTVLGLVSAGKHVAFWTAGMMLIAGVSILAIRAARRRGPNPRL